MDPPRVTDLIEEIDADADEDVRDLKALGKAKTPAAKIARRLKRTEGALRQKALHLGISLNSRA
jgi:hypothetical protein